MNAFEKKKWGVRICGPDIVLAASSFKDATHHCNQINKAMQNMAESGHFDGEHMPVTFAQVDTWDQIGGCADHVPEDSDWSEFE